jgi:hypothetical protein
MGRRHEGGAQLTPFSDLASMTSHKFHMPFDPAGKKWVRSAGRSSVRWISSKARITRSDAAVIQAIDAVISLKSQYRK